MNIIDSTIFETKNPITLVRVNQTIASGCKIDGINIVIKMIGIVDLKNKILLVNKPIKRNKSVRANPVSVFWLFEIFSGIILFFLSIIAYLLTIAEREGFEPSVPFKRDTHLAGERLKPARPPLLIIVIKNLTGEITSQQ